MENMYVLVEMYNALSVKEFSDMMKELSNYQVYCSRVHDDKNLVIAFYRTPLEGLVLSITRREKHVTLGVPYNYVENELIVPVDAKHDIIDVKTSCNYFECTEEYHYNEYIVKAQLIANLTSHNYILLSILSKYMKLSKMQLLVKSSTILKLKQW